MKKLSKIVVLCLMLLLLAGTLLGCGEEDETPTVTTPSYLVTCRLNAPYGDFIDMTIVKGSSIFAANTKVSSSNSYSVREGSKLAASTVQAPSRIPGYEFGGWYVDSDCTTAYDFANTNIEKAINIYAKWISNDMSIACELETTGRFTAETTSELSLRKFNGKINVSTSTPGSDVFEDVPTGIWRYGTTEDYAVPATNRSFDFYSILNVNDSTKVATEESYISDKATFEVYSDAECRTPLIAGNAKPNAPYILENKDNIFYIKIYAEDTIIYKVYKIRVYVEPEYSTFIMPRQGSDNQNTRKMSVYDNALINQTELAEFMSRFTYPGMTQDGWYYNSNVKRNAAGQMIDAEDNILLLENDTYFVVNAAGVKYAKYISIEDSKTLFIEDTDKDNSGKYYYINSSKTKTYITSTSQMQPVTDAAGENFSHYILKGSGKELTRDTTNDTYYYYDSNNKRNVYVSGSNLRLSVDTTGHINYETSEPVYGINGAFELEWDMDSTRVTENNVFIYGKWTPNTYRITLDLGEGKEVEGCRLDGTTEFNVEYGIKAFALAELIKSNIATIYHPYATFAGWYYINGETQTLMVAAGNSGKQEWNIPSDATLVAKWDYKVYDVTVNSKNPTMGTVSGTGGYEYGSTRVTNSISATPESGYEFVRWAILGYGDTPSLTYYDYENPYVWDWTDKFEDDVRFDAEFRPVTKTMTLHNTDPVSTISATYGTIMELPEITAADNFMFIGWYYLRAYNAETDAELDPSLLIDNNADDVIDEVMVFITNANTPLEAYVNWTFTEDLDLYTLVTPNQYSLKVVNALFNKIAMGMLDFGTMDDDDDIVTAITENANGYESKGYSGMFNEGTSFTIEATPSPNYYRFLGWYLVETTSMDFATLFAATPVSTDLTYSISLTENTTLVAMWDYRLVTVTFDAGNLPESDTMTAPSELATIRYGTTNYSVLHGTVSGVKYDFNGWYVDNIAYTDASGKGIKAIDNLGAITNGITFTANWKIRDYFIHPNGIIIGVTDAGKALPELIIPNDSTITGIASSALVGAAVKNLTIYGNITSLGENAFAGCTTLETVTFSGDFKGLIIGANAFNGCIGLTTITFPDNTTAISSGALRGCWNIRELRYSGTMPIGQLFGESNESGTALSYAVNQNGTTYYLPTALTTVYITNTSDTIAPYAFANATSIRTIVLATPKDAKKYTTTIGRRAFYNCDFTTIDMSAVTAIGNNAFEGSAITTLELPKIKSIGGNSFTNCEGLATVTIASTDIDAISIETFKGCVALANLDLSDTVKTIDISAFENCAALTSINSIGVTKVNGRAFFNTNISATSIANDFDNVTSVGEYAFTSNVDTSWYAIANNEILVVGNVLYYNKGATSWSVPNAANIVSIATGAFRDRTSPAATIDLSEMISLATIDNYAFSNVGGLTEIIIPATVRYINQYVFSNTTDLEKVSITGVNSLLQKIGKSSFEGCTALDSIDIAAVSSTLSEIGERAFYGCVGLTAITLPDNLRTLGASVFENCTTLASVTFVANSMFEDTEGEEGTIPATYTFNPSTYITVIPRAAFKNTALVSLELPYFITSIEAEAFYSCHQLTEILTRTGITSTTGKNTAITSIGDYAFATDAAFEGIDALANGFNSVGIAAFEGCSSLQEIRMGSVTVISDRAFNGCSSLSLAAFSSSLNIVGEKAFQGCENLTAFASSVSDVRAYAFNNCSNLTTITFRSGNAKEIGEKAFANCLQLTAVSIPANIEIINANVFSGCTSLKTLNFASAVALKEIGIQAFYGCSILETFLMPNSVEIIGESAFVGCAKLANITIGDAIISLGARVFEGCGIVNGESTIVVTFLGTTPPVLEGAIFCGNSYTVNVQEGFIDTYRAQAVWNEIGVERFTTFQI